MRMIAVRRRLLWVLLIGIALALVVADRAPRSGARSPALRPATSASLAYQAGAAWCSSAARCWCCSANGSSQALEAALFWVVVGFVLAVGYTYRFELRDIGERVLAELMPGPRRASRGGDGRDRARPRRRFPGRRRRSTARASPMVLDTGASAVVLTQEAAKAAGLPLEVLTYTVRSTPRTAAPAPRRSRSTASRSAASSSARCRR